MTRLSPHFYRDEFACKCGCGFDAADVKLLEIVEKIRTYFDKPLEILSGCRCLKHNRKIGSKDTSQHINGLAADIKMKSIETQELYDYIEEHIDPPGLGIYKTWVHVDVRIKGRARWDQRGT